MIESRVDVAALVIVIALWVNMLTVFLVPSRHRRQAQGLILAVVGVAVLIVAVR